ncbi:MAG TPA: zf-HC2 domain-containing protein [Ktedonobacteraceae bacterium]|nr:zf-HC2 domain-containing protein [Ktedonobacteraceae bacterium]
MTAQIPHEREHMADLLPAYVNGQLETSSARVVREHLLSCASCRLELLTWEALKDSARQVYAETPLPSPQLMEQVWSRIASEEMQTVGNWSPTRLLRRGWQVFRAQIPLIHKSLWIASALVCLFGLVLVLAMAHDTVGHARWAGNLLVLFIVVAGASGSAFIYGSAVDPGFELAIATPTSVRLVMICRMIIVLGYNFLLGMLASAVFAAVYGGGLWGMVQLWLGPLLFLSSLCLAISLFVSSAFALICTAVIEMLQAFPATLGDRLGFPLPILDLGPTSPALLIGALLLIVCAVFFMPKQPRLAS